MVKLARAAWLAGALLFAGLASAGQGAAPGAGQPVTFNRDVAPILRAHCAPCHRPGESAPFSLLGYDEARQRARLIATATRARVMPPWQPESDAGHFVGERRLPPDAIETLARWAADGAPEGDAAERPVPPAYVSGWQLGTPDVVVTMAEALEVPADGPDVFRNVVLALPLEERRFVRALEFRPGNARVLHHARLLLDDTGESRRLDAAEPGAGFGGMEVRGARFPDGHFLGWAPGKQPDNEAYPWPLEPGNDLVVQMHLKPSGRPERVQATVGLYLSDAPPPRTPVMLRLGSKTIDIPPGEAGYGLMDTLVLPVGVSVLSIYPHAHYLATEMSVTATRPDGRAETLLRIPRWNFNWQDDYTFTRPIDLPRGSTIAMRYRYDNSSANPSNPSSPPGRVRFGVETRDEMGELLVQVLPRTDADAAALRAFVTRKNLLTDIAGGEKRVADVPGDAETRNALGVGYVQLGRVGDAVAQFEASLRTAPELAVAHYNLGVIAMGENRAAEAIARFERAIASRPGYTEAHNNLGVVLESSGRAAEAERHYRTALALRPNHPGAHNNLGRLLLASGAVDDARAEFQAALRTQPESPEARYNLGRAYAAVRQPRLAVEQWRRALVSRPDNLTFLLDLAWLLATNEEVRDPGEAVRLAERASGLAGNVHPVALDVLAAAYAAELRIDLAIRTARSALERALATRNEPLAAEIRQRLRRYEQMAEAGVGRPGFP